MTNNFLIDNFKHLTTTPENVEQLKKLFLQMAVQGKLTAIAVVVLGIGTRPKGNFLYLYRAVVECGYCIYSNR